MGNIIKNMGIQRPEKTNYQSIKELTSFFRFETTKNKNRDEMIKQWLGSLYAIPVAVTKPDPETETSYQLSPDEKRVLMEGLERYYGKENVYVSRYILNFENMERDGHRICDLGRTYFETGSEALLMKFDTQKCLGINRELFFISYVVKRPIEKIHFTLKELQEGTKRFASEGVLADIPEITDVAKKVFFDASQIELPDTPMLVNANSLF